MGHVTVQLQTAGVFSQPLDEQSEWPVIRQSDSKQARWYDSWLANLLVGIIMLLWTIYQAHASYVWDREEA